MIIPVRCLSCGKPIGQLWEEFNERVDKGESKEKALTALGLDRYCCRGVFMGQVDLIDIAAEFKRS